MIILIPYLRIFTPGSSGLTELQLLLKKIAGRERMGGALDYYRQKQAGESGLDKLLGNSTVMVGLERLLT